jgi:DNA-binding beta-propeller fold protein YncE
MRSANTVSAALLCVATLACVSVATLAAGVASERGALPLKAIADIPLPGPANRFDYQSYDPRTHLLFIAHLSAGTVVAFDTESQKVVAEIPRVSQVHGVLVVSQLNRVYASATGTSEIVVIHTQTLREVARIPGGVYPDGMAYAPDVQKLYVSDQSGRTETVIDVKLNKRVATIQLGGEAGNSQYDPGSKHIFVNVQTSSELVEIDPRTDKIIARHPLPGADHNHGLLIEPVEHLAFIACEGNAKVLVLDMQTMRVASVHPVGEDPDVLAFDDGLRLLYVAGESGIVSVFREEGKKLVKIGEGLLAPNAHSVAVEPQTHRVYFPLQNMNGHPVLRVLQPVSAN